MSVLDLEKSLIFIVDVQERLVNAAYSKDVIIKNSEIISKAAEVLKIPVIISEQYPKGLGETIPEIKNNLKHDKVFYFEKTDFNALNVEDIRNKIKSFRVKQVILCGIETHICVSQTAEALIDSGYEVSVLSDLCSSRSEKEHIAGLELMKQNGAYIKTTEIALFELLKSAKHPEFKEIQSLIKN